VTFESPDFKEKHAMSTLPPEAALPPLLEGRFSGRDTFADLIRLALATAAAQGWREIILSDPDFEDWPLGERAVAQALNDWSRSGRKFTLLAADYAELGRRHARFVTWRRTWAHLVECRKNAATSADSLPSALWSPGWVLERMDLPRCIGTAGSEVARRVALKERLNEVLLKSSPAFPATTLGL
jgi:hypothetical protein